MSTAKPPVTYARRHRARSAAAQNTTVSLPSSPLEELSPSKQDVPISEMTRRMKKRSRQVSSGGDESLRDASYRSAKKLKRRSQGDLRASEHVSLAPTVPSTPVMLQDAPTFPLDSQQIYDSLFETPACTTTEDTIMRSYLQPIAPEDLSPVPVSRRMLSRTSSRNFKENRKSLASPFNSRPASRAASPRRYSKTPIKPLQNRSRTFSSSNYSQHRKSASVSRYTNSQTEETKDSIFDSIYSSAQAPASHATQSHTRTGSIPNVSSNLLDHISTEDWLVPPKAMSRSPPSLEDMDLDDFSAEHPSFYFDAPVQASSPPRRRRTTVTLRDFRPMVSNRSQSDSMLLDSTQPSASQDITVTEDGSKNPTSNLRGRRRTVVHMSGDSIFSSALDFSAYMTEGSPTKVHKILVPPVNLSSRGLSATQSAPGPPAPPGLDPAFSPAPVFFPPPAGTPESNSANVSITTACLARQVPPTPYVPRPSLSRRTRSLLESPESDKLHEMFTSLGLDGMPLASLVVWVLMLSVLSKKQNLGSPGKTILVLDWISSFQNRRSAAGPEAIPFELPTTLNHR